MIGNMQTKLDQFDRKQYLNLETFRKNGDGVKTPVWFVQEGESLFISTVAGSGKVKRIRNNQGVNVVACKMDGKVTSEWAPAQGCEVIDPALIEKVDHLLEKKYGLMYKLSKNRRDKKGGVSAILEIKLIEKEEK